jgi:hypothetical protein
VHPSLSTSSPPKNPTRNLGVLSFKTHFHSLGVESSKVGKRATGWKFGEGGRGLGLWLGIPKLGTDETVADLSAFSRARKSLRDCLLWMCLMSDLAASCPQRINCSNMNSRGQGAQGGGGKDDRHVTLQSKRRSVVHKPAFQNRRAQSQLLKNSYPAGFQGLQGQAQSRSNSRSGEDGYYRDWAKGGMGMGGGGMSRGGMGMGSKGGISMGGMGSIGLGGNLDLHSLHSQSSQLSGPGDPGALLSLSDSHNHSFHSTHSAQSHLTDPFVGLGGMGVGGMGISMNIGRRPTHTPVNDNFISRKMSLNSRTRTEPTQPTSPMEGDDSITLGSRGDISPRNKISVFNAPRLMPHMPATLGTRYITLSICSMLYALCSILYTLHSMLYAACSMLFIKPPLSMPYITII